MMDVTYPGLEYMLPNCRALIAVTNWSLVSPLCPPASFLSPSSARPHIWLCFSCSKGRCGVLFHVLATAEGGGTFGHRSRHQLIRNFPGAPQVCRHHLIPGHCAMQYLLWSQGPHSQPPTREGCLQILEHSDLMAKGQIHPDLGGGSVCGMMTSTDKEPRHHLEPSHTGEAFRFCVQCTPSGNTFLTTLHTAVISTW